MKQILLITIIALLGTSCRKEVPITQNQQLHNENSITVSNSVQAVPISYSETIYVPAGVSVFNSCTQEYINFSGTARVQIRGMISDNKITYILHYNGSNIKGVGQISGTPYVTTEAFNYSNTANFNTEFTYQQRYSLHYIALGKESNFTLENDWHLTVNANGDVTFFFTTGGDIVKCQN